MCNLCTGQNEEAIVTAEQRDEWVKALRSGEYKQANSQLVYKGTTGDVGYCCLGVYGLLNGGTEDLRQNWMTFEGVTDSTGELEPQVAYVPSGVMASSAQSLFAGLNDGAGLSFEQIADVIEKMPLGALRDNKWWEARPSYRDGLMLALKAFKIGRNNQPEEIEDI